MDKEEILYNEIYERTKDFGRTHFIKEIMRLQKELEQLKEIEKEHQKMNGELRIEIKELKGRIDKAVEYIEQLEENEWRCFGRKILIEILKGGKEWNGS
mgnify:CR=1 FL=1